MPSTAPYDHPSVHNIQTPSGTRRHKANATGEVPSRQALKISHQKVSVDIDFANQTIKGETEITVSPLEPNLKQVKLDARNIQVHEVFVNNKRSTFRYNDFNKNDEFLNDPQNYYVKDLTPKSNFNADFKFNPHYDLNSKNFDIHQHHLYKSKYHPTYGNTNHLDELNINTDPQQVQQYYHHPYTPLLLTNTEELIIDFPEGVRLKLQNNNSLSHFSPTKSNINTPFSAANTMNTQEQLYTPVYIKIIYTVRNPMNGFIFNGGLKSKVSKDEWFCYTTNNDLNFSTSCWVPCVDNFYEKNTWDINISVPKTVGDIGDSKIIGTKAADMAMKKQQREENGDYDDYENNTEESHIDLKREIVVASPELLNYAEVPHTTDFSKKIVSFQIYNPIAPHHIGFAAGPFKKLPMIGFTDDTKDQEYDKNNTPNSISNVPANIYYLPDRKDDVINTCMFLFKAMDFYSKEFGSFPFNSYTMVFLKDFPSTSCGFAGISLVSDKLLYASNKVEPMLSCTETLSTVLAQQWSGINVVPKTHNDIWCILGIAEFMASQFSKKIFGLNEFKYRNKLKSDLVCEQDIRKRPLANQFFRFPINDDSDLNFLKLKSSLVMIILDHRMTKTDKSFGLSRVIPKIFLQAMSGDLFNGNCLSTYHFKHVCEKVNHSKLDNFFKNWVYSSGTPVLRFSQRFNKKRMVIELTVRQVQVQELNNRNDDGMLSSGLSSESRHADDNFINDSVNFIENVDSEFNVPSIFQGPMTIRVHEADGTPYEHIVELKDGVSKLDIPYNTKYRRLKRGRRKQVDMINEEDAEDSKTQKDNQEDVKINCFGDVLQTPEEMRSWNLQDWSKEDEENQNNESFEWIRVDADFEWICKVHLIQPDYMYHSQLQQDRDIEAQIESVRFFANTLKPLSLYSSILAKTVMDKRYFYGVRIEAVIGLAKLAKEELSFIGLRHLLKCFQELYCYKTRYDISAPIDENNYLPLPNNFENVGDLFVLEIIPKLLASIKSSNGEVPFEVRKILLNLLKFNDNLSNKFDDCFYVVTMIEAIFTSVCNSGGFLLKHPENIEYTKFMDDITTELNRMVKLDEFLPSFDNLVTREVLRQKVKATRLGLHNISIKELLSFTAPSLNNELRISAFDGLLTLGGLKNSDLLHYYFTVCKIDDSPRLKLQLIKVFLRVIAIAAIHGTPSLLDDPEFDKLYLSKEMTLEKSGSDGEKSSGVVFIEDGSNKTHINSRRDAFARATIAGAINILRRDYAFGKGLRNEIWTALHSNLLSIHSKRDLFDICDVLYEARNSFIVTVDKPNEKKIIAKIGKVDITELDNHLKVYEILFQRKGRLKIQLPNFLDKKKVKKPKIENPQSPIPIPKIKLSKSVVLGKLADAPVSLDIEPDLKSLPPKLVPATTTKLSTLQTKKSTGKIVSLKFKSTANIEKLKSLLNSRSSRAHVEIRRSAPNLPLRYVKISTNSKVKLFLSSEPFKNDTVQNNDKKLSTVLNKPMVTVDNGMHSIVPSMKIKIKHEKLKKSTMKNNGNQQQSQQLQTDIIPSISDQFVNKNKSHKPFSKELNPTYSNWTEPTSTTTKPASKTGSTVSSTPVLPRPKIKLKISFDKTKK